ncbi:hypothetical protein FS595_10430 [Serratia rubidaea]|uniref:hypothetical protein n=1 Tax=Serratia rubidaea TaxID=61652 RepID=UPI001F1BCB58|nr:hypothetical protein [Serratia rubidaea]UJD80093.1 hypothetical protein FS596_10430 [Serratia rubidaea]UJD84649.1 hypothetical protein FS595_10430 [Serratia rubidaea]HDJ1441624.1 hypothetical protein [Serratia rubidaea]HDJ1447211.1 hypothetical protein [Serratia rubidaea]HDJ1463262.1 hypothetical protein [Serratia rubidaea]
MTGLQTPKSGYELIRCSDSVVVAKFSSFPDCERALMYRKGDQVSFMPLREDEIVGTPSLITQILERAGYRVTSSDTLT